MLEDRNSSGPGFSFAVRTGSLNKAVKAAVKKGLKESGRIYLDSVVENISLDDHTLEELRAMGHPYATRANLAVHLGNESGEQAHDDDRLVHTQSGKLVASVHMTPVTDEDKTLSTQLVSDDPVFQWLIHGTSKMRPRRFHEKAYEDKKNEIWEPLRTALTKIKER